MNTPPDMARDIGQEMVKAAPPVAAWALTPNTVVAIMTGIYVAVQIAYLIRMWLREERRKAAGS